MKKIFAICGSTREHSSNALLLQSIKETCSNLFELSIFKEIGNLPHFNPDNDGTLTPPVVIAFREQIARADGIIICTPEYVFSLPGSLKNALEWCVSTTVLARKPTALITASASGEKAQEELMLVMKTLEAAFNNDTTLLIKGIKSKINNDAIVTDDATQKQLDHLINALQKLLQN